MKNLKRALAIALVCAALNILIDIKNWFAATDANDKAFLAISSIVTMIMIGLFFVSFKKVEARRPWSKWAIFALAVTIIGPVLIEPKVIIGSGVIQGTLLGVVVLLLLYSIYLIMTIPTQWWLATEQGAPLFLRPFDSSAAETQGPLSPAVSVERENTIPPVQRYGWLIWVVAFFMVCVLFVQGKFDPAIQWVFENVGLSGPELSVEIHQPSRHSNERFGFVSVTNLGNQPVLLKRLSINNSKQPGCNLDSTSGMFPSKPLAPGERSTIGSSAMIIGGCGSIIRVIIDTDRGSSEHNFSWR